MRTTLNIVQKGLRIPSLYASFSEFERHSAVVNIFGQKYCNSKFEFYIVLRDCGRIHTSERATHFHISLIFRLSGGPVV